MAVVTGRRWVAMAITLAMVAAACTKSSDPVASASDAATDGEPVSTPPTPLIVDTDMGAGDIMALAFLLDHPSVDVRAVTVSATGLTRCEAGVLNALALTTLIGVDVPVACGAEPPATSTTAFPSPWRDAADAFYGLDLAAPTSSSDDRPAAQLIAETVTSSDEPVTILTLGPLTNLAAALRETPTIIEGIDHIYSLAGAVDVPGDTGAVSAAEWNLSLDPGAAAAVLQSGVGITFIPLDATVEGAPPGVIATLLDGADSVTGRLFSDLAERVAADGQPALLRDPLAASVVVDESVAAYQMIAIAIDSQGVVSRSSDGVRVRVAVSMDDDRFAETFASSSVAPSEDQEAVSPLADAPNGRVVWRFDLESTPLAAGGAKSRSGVADGVAYFVGLDDRIYALDAATGDKLWSRDLEEEGPSFVEVALSPEAFFFQNQTFDPDGPAPISTSIEGVDRATGEEIWRVQLDVPTQGAAGNPAYGDGLVYYTTDETGMVAADALTGETVWTFDAPAFISAGAASVVDGTAYFGALDGSVYALDAFTGERRWRVKTRLSGFGVTSSPAVADGVVYFGSDSGQFLAVDADSGEVIWEFEVQPVQGLPSSPAVADGIVYFGVFAPSGSRAFGGLIALAAASGEELWRFGGPDLDMISSPAYENGVVYVVAPAGDTGVGGLAALDAQSGTVLWWFELDGAPSDSPVVVDGTVYFQANGSFLAVEPPA